MAENSGCPFRDKLKSTYAVTPSRLTSKKLMSVLSNKREDQIDKALRAWSIIKSNVWL